MPGEFVLSNDGTGAERGVYEEVPGGADDNSSWLATQMSHNTGLLNKL